MQNAPTRHAVGLRASRIGTAYIFCMSSDEKPLAWLGSSYRDLPAFPPAARRAVGHNLGLVQNGLMPEDIKPMEQIGAGTYEMRVQSIEGGAVIHRVFFVARVAEAVYVLHAFQKNSRATNKHDIDLGRARYRTMVEARRRNDS